MGSRLSEESEVNNSDFFQIFTRGRDLRIPVSIRDDDTKTKSPAPTTFCACGRALGLILKFWSGKEII